MSATSSHISPGEPHRSQVSQAQRTAEAKEAFNAALKSVGSNIDSELQARAKNIHAMDRSLTKQERELQRDTRKLAKQNDEMQKFVDKSNKQLANLGDMESSRAGLDTDLEDIEEMLRMIEEDVQSDHHSS